MKRFLLLLLLFLAGCQSKYPIERARYVAPLDTTVAYEKPRNFSTSKGLIIIDPGHGGEDEGTKSLTKPVYSEKSFNLITAKFLVSYLRQMGYKVMMTRTDDTFIPLKTRYEFANNQKPLLFVSVHYNAAASPEAKGIEVFYYRSDDNKDRTQASKKLAQSTLNQLLTVTQAKSRGVKHGDYAVIRETNIPAILVEGGFLSNEEELRKIKDPEYLKQIAWGISQGIDGYLSGQRQGI
jgi:N-acetylmuramoyl-L-alanine amidase